ncbi:hypothetical protein K437DRAFT_188330 [Tilletiaria anomala UBC 951]|uniref:Uncharacterized protein n=1 Tax=Tilletiaria anomala (strain ATCC 24038 / CBS 436.72 / UBC 951) TaxID=1037660 RepID=A0A066VP28_TILAU|nr:uncharacterized protein K437DRAFT_188330 [Tilletiaria anomala UBC 951]KDN40524.1 hypothetical protein K437DRAFT_188330 [Tilletiaria anomala UBC 951]
MGSGVRTHKNSGLGSTPSVSSNPGDRPALFSAASASNCTTWSFYLFPLQLHMLTRLYRPFIHVTLHLLNCLLAFNQSIFAPSTWSATSQTLLAAGLGPARPLTRFAPSRGNPSCSQSPSFHSVPILHAVSAIASVLLLAPFNRSSSFPVTSSLPSKHLLSIVAAIYSFSSSVRSALRASPSTRLLGRPASAIFSPRYPAVVV